MFMESCLKRLEHKVVEFSLCHLGRFANPWYRDRVNSAALAGFTMDLFPANRNSTIVPSG